MMSPKLVIVFSALLVAAQAANKPRIDFRMPSLGLNCVVGGVETTQNEFPHQVSLQWGLPPLVKYSHFCGGTVINNSWILTAGHCVIGVPDYGSFVVKAGKHQLLVSESTEQTIEVAARYIHESFVGNYEPNDIALLKLKTPLRLDKATNVISLPKAGSRPTGTSILAGWGSISPAGTNLPKVLQKADVPIVDFNICGATLKSIVGTSPLHANNLCTGITTAGYAACTGDSGGPLIAKNTSGVFEVVGVLSWGISPCGTKGAPSVYTNVGTYITWIQNTIQKN